MIHLPAEVTAWLRGVFNEADVAASSKLAMNPNIHEPMIDHSIIESLQRFSAPYVVKGDWKVFIDTHWLGGFPMYERWEIADFGLLVMFSSGGKLVRSKLVLLQAKRLMAGGAIAISEPDFVRYYEHGFGRLALSDNEIAQAFSPKVFEFDEDCEYSALVKEDNQWEAIVKYQTAKQIPVFYLFYNPPVMPVSITVPHIGKAPELAHEIGCRVISSAEVHAAMEERAKGDVPTFKMLMAKTNHTLGDFIADQVLQCKAGRIIDVRADDGLRAAFYQRTRPIQAAISVTIDAPADFPWDVEPDDK